MEFEENSQKAGKYNSYTMLDSKKITLPQPDGAFYLFCNFEKFRGKLESKNIYSSTDLTNSCLKKPVWHYCLVPFLGAQTMSLQQDYLMLILMVHVL